MPPRKSNASIVTTADGEVPTPTTQKSRDSLGVEDLSLPRSIIQRLVKGCLPPNSQLQKDAVLAMSKSTTVFINYLASCAGEHAAVANKKTMVAADVFAALKELEFESFLPRVEAQTQRYTDIQNEKRNAYRRSKKADQNTTTATVEGTAADGEGTHSSTTTKDNGTDNEPPSKKIRTTAGAEAVDEEDDGDADPEEEADEADEDGDEDADSDAADSAEDENADEAEEGGAEEEAKGDFDDDRPEDDNLLDGIRDEALDEPDSD